MSSSTITLNKNYSTISNKSELQNNNATNKSKKITNLNAYTFNSKTVDRRDIKDNMSFNKMSSMMNLNNSKDDINNINIDKNYIKNEIINSQIKKEILIPQTPQITKETFLPILTEEKVDNKIDIKIDIKNNNKNDNKINIKNDNKNDNKIEIKNNNKNDIKEDNKNDNKIQNNIQNKIEIKTNKNSEFQDFINKNKEEDKNRINFLKEYKEILDKFGSNLNQNIKKDN
jgi:hypothetical protein